MSTTRSANSASAGREHLHSGERAVEARGVEARLRTLAGSDEDTFGLRLIVHALDRR